MEELHAWLEALPKHLCAWADSHKTDIFKGNAEEAAPQPSSAEAAGAAREPEAAPAPAPAAVPALAPPAPAPAAPVSPMASPRPMASSGPAQPPGAVFAVDDDALVQEWWRVRDDKSPTNWVLLGIKAGGARGAKTQVEVVGNGEGGLKEMVEHMDDTKVLFGGFRVVAIDDKTGVTSYRPKFVAIVWVGEKMPAMAKAKVTMQRADFAKIFQGAHLNLQVSDLGELTAETIESQLQANAGAHKPSRYEF
uniref:ADF-H domain-containing protein n=1 Tax=Eutreptiella gymnastica TaxID=73025 RepID=A0A7S4GD49_9EUGL